MEVAGLEKAGDYRGEVCVFENPAEVSRSDTKQTPRKHGQNFAEDTPSRRSPTPNLS
jgi:hypothetical protein